MKSNQVDIITMGCSKNLVDSELLIKQFEANGYSCVHDSSNPEGDIIYLKKKQKRAEKIFKNRPHIVRAGESLYDIAQMYGIRLKSLYKMNNFSPDHQIYVGEAIRVY